LVGVVSAVLRAGKLGIKIYYFCQWVISCGQLDVIVNFTVILFQQKQIIILFYCVLRPIDGTDKLRALKAQKTTVHQTDHPETVQFSLLGDFLLCFATRQYSACSQTGLSA
jgi:hypothetical protein